MKNTALFIKRNFISGKKVGKSWWPIILVTIVAFFIRLYMIRYRFMPEGDGCHYVAFAKDFMHGNFSTIGVGFYKALVTLIYIFGFVVKDLEFAGRFINVISGALLVLASFILVEKIFNRKVAYYAVLLITINLNLILYSTLIFSESLYAFSIMLIALSGWICLERKKLAYYFLLGTAIGFSYTARNEALVFVPIFVLSIIINDYKKALANILLLFFGIILFVFPVLLFHRWQYNVWALGDKGIVNFLYGDDGAFSYRKVNELTNDFTKNKYYAEVYNKFKGQMLVYLYENKFFIGRLLINFKRVLHYLPNQFLAVPFMGRYISLSFFIYGSYICLKNRALRVKYFYLLLFPLTAYLTVSLCFMEERKIIPFIPFFIFIICLGIYQLEQSISSKKIRFIYYSLLTAVFLISFFIAFNKAKINIIGDAHMLMKETGLWMRHNLSQKEKVVISGPDVPYYFYEDTPNNFSNLPYADYQTIIRYTRFHKAKYLVVFSWLVENNPCVEFLFKNREPPDLELLRSIKRSNIEALLYQLK